ncbi:MAG TPA: C45 family peptidase [archaeon]|nr:C45 family peptidase [archaeon]
MKQRFLKVILPLMVVVLIVLGYFLYNPVRTILSLEKLDAYPLYSVTYHGGYGFDRLLERGHEESPSWLHPCYWSDIGCSVFASLADDSNPILGRNLDMTKDDPTLLLFTDPPDGYASVSLIDIFYFGFSKEKPSILNRLALLAAPHFPFDGMNEAGVAIGVMAVPHASYEGNPDKTNISNHSVIRKVLDYAGSVEEALELMDDHNIDFSCSLPLHYLLADRSGNSAVVEYVDSEMRVLRSEQPWQAATNFIISETSAEDISGNCERYNLLSKILKGSGGVLNMGEAMSLLKDVSKNKETVKTTWSVAYGMSTGEIQLAVGRQYDKIHTFQLDMLE